MQQGHALLACSLMLAHLNHVMVKGINTKVSFFPQRNLIKLEYHHNTHPPPHTHHTCILVNLLWPTKHTNAKKRDFSLVINKTRLFAEYLTINKMMLLAENHKKCHPYESECYLYRLFRMFC